MLRWFRMKLFNQISISKYVPCSMALFSNRFSFTGIRVSLTRDDADGSFTDLKNRNASSVPRNWNRTLLLLVGSRIPGHSYPSLHNKRRPLPRPHPWQTFNWVIPRKDQTNFEFLLLISDSLSMLHLKKGSLIFLLKILT